MPSNERSAEWCRGAVESHINTCNLITSITSATKSHPARQGLMAAGNELHNQLDRYRALLADAEASEASVPTEADLAVADELERLAEHVQTLPPDDYRDDIRRICRNRAEDLRRGVKRGPSAAEVISAAEKALEKLRQYICTHHITYLDRTPDGDRLRAMKHEAREYVESGKHLEALATITAWEAGQ